MAQAWLSLSTECHLARVLLGHCCLQKTPPAEFRDVPNRKCLLSTCTAPQNMNLFDTTDISLAFLFLLLFVFDHQSLSF